MSHGFVIAAVTLHALGKDLRVLALAALAACNIDSLPTAMHPATTSGNTISHAGDRELTIMTYNVYQGTELENSIAATTPQEFVVALPHAPAP